MGAGKGGGARSGGRALGMLHMSEHLKLALEANLSLEQQVKAIAKEAGLARTAISEVERHLEGEGHLFGQCRTEVANFIKRYAPPEDEKAKEDARRMDQTLVMAKHRSDSLVKKMKPLGRASTAVAAASQHVLSLQDGLDAVYAMHGMQELRGGGGVAAAPAPSGPSATVSALTRPSPVR